MPSIDDEEETLCLLAADQEESPGPRQPGHGSVASYNQITPSVAWDDGNDVTSGPDDKPLVQLKNEDSSKKLAAGNAERTFFTVCGTSASQKRHYTTSSQHDNNDDDDDDDDDESDEESVAQRRRLISDEDDGDAGKNVRASIQVVNEILTDIEDGTNFRREKQVPVSSQQDDEASFSASTSTSRSLVVDVHLPPEDHLLRPYKHEINRFQRCYSDGSQSSPKRKGMMSKSSMAQHHHEQQQQQHSEGFSRSNNNNNTSLENDSFQNIDKIETICESDPKQQQQQLQKQQRDSRFRHSSECAGLGSLPFETGFRGFKLHEEFLHFRQNLFEGRQLFFGSTSDNSSKRKSDSDVLGAIAPASTSQLVKFDDSSAFDNSAGRRPLSELTQGCGNGGAALSVKGSGAPKKTIRLNSPFSSFPSAALANSSVITSSSCSTTSTTDEPDQKKALKKSSAGAAGTSPYTFFTMESDDDFDFDCDNVDNKSIEDDDDDDFDRHPAMKFSAADFEDHKSTISQSSSTLSLPVCRICQLPSMEPNNHLISPCRCLGSIRYVHNNCLLKWLEVSSKRRNGPACCELCQYQYLRHKKFVISHWRFPECSLKDKILHFFFVISVCLMIGCAAVTIICFKEDRGPYRSPNKFHTAELSPPEMITLSCGVLFFLAFFLAMYVEVKARHTVYQLICKFFYLNHEWSVEEYDRKRDLVTSKKKKEKVKKKRNSNNDQNS